VLSHDRAAEHAVGARQTVRAAAAFIAAFIQTMPLSGAADIAGIPRYFAFPHKPTFIQVAILE
jgi:hypothetical protein